MLRLPEFRGRGEKVAPPGMSRVKIFKSIRLTLSDSRGNTFLIHKASGQRRQRLRLITEGLWDVGRCRTAAGAEACAQGSP